MPSQFGDISSNVEKDLITHLKKASFFITNPHISQCIDGRRTENESNFGISIPGGGIGQLAIILSVLEETIIGQNSGFREDALEILFEVIGGKENLSFHTDEHCLLGKIGCGHISLLLEPEARKRYGLSDQSADFIKDVMKKQEKTAIINILKGKHEEVGIIKVYSTHHSIHANFDNKQYFIYTPKLAYIRNKEIARKIYNKFIKGTNLSITSDALCDMLQRKLDLNFYYTITTLAPNLPVYRLKHSLSGNIKYLEKIYNEAKEVNFESTFKVDL